MAGMTPSGMVYLSGPGGDMAYNAFVTEGLWESYGTSMQQFADNGQGLLGVYGTSSNPLGPPNGVPKYGVFAWYDFETMNSRGWQTSDYNWSKDKNIKWKPRGAYKPSSFSTGIVVYCQQGQSDNWCAKGGGIVNYGSHRQRGVGGTYAVLADAHVEWIEGTRIGWP
jgi:hypothetical protein